jgi:hypothetical protein
VRIRAEHESLAQYLQLHLSPEQLQRPVLPSFTQWDFAVAALADMTISLSNMGAVPTVALWSHDTPLRDIGWQTDRRIASLLRSPTIDRTVELALVNSGMSADTVVTPPIKNWTPQGKLPVPADYSRETIRQLMYRGSPLGRAILQAPPSSQTPSHNSHTWPKKYVDRAIRSYAFVFDQVTELISQARATCAFIYNGRFLHDSAADAAAIAAGIPCLYYDTGGLHTDFDVTIDNTHDWARLQERMTDMFSNWPDSERQELASRWFEDRIHHIETANQMFTGNQVRGSGISSVDGNTSEKPTVVYFSSSGDEVAELDLDWSKYFYSQEEALASVKSACDSLGYSLIVRTHPHNRVKPAEDVRRWVAAVESVGPDIHLDHESPADSYTLMKEASAVVTYGSTTGVEAGYQGRPVIVMGPSAYDLLGCARRVTSMQELTQALRDLVNTPPNSESIRFGSLPYGLMMLRRGFTFEHVNSQTRELGGVNITEPSELVRHLSHALNRRTKARLAD